jgi:hypothetical protein
MRRTIYLKHLTFLFLILFLQQFTATSQTPIEEPERIYEFLDVNQECLNCHGK